jgi:hypothetical protein
MPDIAPNVEEQEEFWKPAVAAAPQSAEEVVRPACRNCGTELLIGSRFCYICGVGRHIAMTGRPTGLGAWFDLTHLLESLGQNLASLIALVLGAACIVAAVVTGFFFTVTTLLDWQAIQIWRIEWLLGAIALFTAGILLRKRK